MHIHTHTNWFLIRFPVLDTHRTSWDNENVIFSWDFYWLIVWKYFEPRSPVSLAWTVPRSSSRCSVAMNSMFRWRSMNWSQHFLYTMDTIYGNASGGIEWARFCMISIFSLSTQLHLPSLTNGTVGGVNEKPLTCVPELAAKFCAWFIWPTVEVWRPLLSDPMQLLAVVGVLCSETTGSCRAP